MRQHESIIGRRISYNDSRYDDLTVNGEYIVLDEKRHPRFEWSVEEILLTNNDGEDKWYTYNIYGVLHFNLLSGMFIRYVGIHPNDELSHNKLYELFDRYSDEYYYFINDKGSYVGMRKINYIGGKKNFEEISLSELREKRIDEILE